MGHELRKLPQLIRYPSVSFESKKKTKEDKKAKKVEENTGGAEAEELLNVGFVAQPAVTPKESFELQER